MQTKYIKVANGQVYVCTWTPEIVGNTRPLILLHDSLGSVALWRDFPDALAKSLKRPVLPA